MNSKPPFIRQERSDTCILACLRMLLAHEQIISDFQNLFTQIAQALPPRSFEE
jgi:hypothetical protein